MDEDKFALVEKIIKDIDNIISKNAELYAFDIVPVDINCQNKSPVLHLENCLGIESWCIKHVYMYCYSELMDKYISKPKWKTYKLTSMNSEKLKRLINVTLLLNPELSTIWNKRREMVLKCLIEKSSELQFTRLVLSRKPKCNDAFAHRRWILEEVLKDKTIPQSCIQNFLNEELRICELASEKSPNNYHSWNHRMWLINTLKTVSPFNLDLLYINEYQFSERWTPKHVSDFSCFHYRQFCIKNIFNIKKNSWDIFQNAVETNLSKSFMNILIQNLPKDMTIGALEENLLSCTGHDLINIILCYTSKNCKCHNDHVFICRILEVLFYELVLNNELLCFYKHHETLWYHRRFIIHEIMLTIYNYCGFVKINGTLTKKPCRKCNNIDDTKQKQPKIVRYDSNQIYSSVLFIVLFNHEKRFIEARRNDSDNYADRHEKYLKFVVGWNSTL